MAPNRYAVLVVTSPPVDPAARGDAAAWAGYTAGLTPPQVDAKIAADPVFIEADRLARDAMDHWMHERGRSSAQSMAATAVIVDTPDREASARPREGTARRSTRSGTRRDRPRPRACRVAGVPHFSPHDLRHRRVSRLHADGLSWARIGELVGHTDLVTTARTYTHVITDGAALDYAVLVG